MIPPSFDTLAMFACFWTHPLVGNNIFKEPTQRALLQQVPAVRDKGSHLFTEVMPNGLPPKRWVCPCIILSSRSLSLGTLKTEWSYVPAFPVNITANLTSCRINKKIVGIDVGWTTHVINVYFHLMIYMIILHLFRFPPKPVGISLAPSGPRWRPMFAHWERRGAWCIWCENHWIPRRSSLVALGNR